MTVGVVLKLICEFVEIIVANLERTASLSVLLQMTDCKQLAKLALLLNGDAPHLVHLAT